MFNGKVDYQGNPSFKVGKYNQWYEDGFFYHDGKYYLYSDDRHEQIYHSEVIAESRAEFEEYCEDGSTDIPDSFWEEVKKRE